MDSLGFIKHKSGWAALPWPGCRNEDCVFVPPFEEEITFPLVPLWLMAVGCCAHRKGRCPLIQTIWAGSVVRHRLSNILWLNQSPDDCSFVDGGVALIGGWRQTLLWLCRKKNKALRQTFLLLHYYCCNFWSVAQPSFISEVYRTQKLAFANFPTHHPPLLQCGYENMPHDNLCAHCVSYAL